MRAFLILLVVTVAWARPEAPYNYPRPLPPQPPSFVQQSHPPPPLPPPTSYGTPVQPQIHFPSAPPPQQHYAPPSQPAYVPPQPALPAPNREFGFASSGSQVSAGGFSGYPSERPTGGEFISSANFDVRAPPPAPIPAPLPPQPPIIQKHIYVHVPPPEPIEEQRQALSAAAAPRTNYKIIFIKAPTVPAVSPQVIQQQQQSQEKTIVYVLVKKPDEQETLTLQGLPPSKPSKPEVYFIKYKARSEQAPAPFFASDSSSNVAVSNQYGAPPVAPPPPPRPLPPAPLPIPQQPHVHPGYP